jgi:hypothetical protein
MIGDDDSPSDRWRPWSGPAPAAGYCERQREREEERQREKRGRGRERGRRPWKGEYRRTIHSDE